MDFLVLPPEVNSVRVHTGVGSGSLLAAAAAWDGLAADLRSAAASFGSVTILSARSERLVLRERQPVVTGHGYVVSPACLDS